MRPILAVTINYIYMERTYVFNQEPNGGGSKFDIMALLPNLMGGKGVDPGLLALLNQGRNNQDAWGGGMWWIWIILLWFCWGGNGFGGFGNLSSCKLDTGLTYSNYSTHETVMVIGINSSAEEFMNSFCHERKHLEMHIAKAFDLNPWGEEVAYLSGKIGQKMYRVAKKFLCEHCRKLI